MKALLAVSGQISNCKIKQMIRSDAEVTDEICGGWMLLRRVAVGPAFYPRKETVDANMLAR